MEPTSPFPPESVSVSKNELKPHLFADFLKTFENVCYFCTASCDSPLIPEKLLVLVRWFGGQAGRGVGEGGAWGVLYAPPSEVEASAFLPKEAKS